jgi:hypothetical protein
MFNEWYCSNFEESIITMTEIRSEWKYRQNELILVAQFGTISSFSHSFEDRATHFGFEFTKNTTVLLVNFLYISIIDSTSERDLN